MRLLSLLCFFLCSTAFAASNEGELKMKFSMPGGMTGNIIVHFSKAGTRSEMISDGNAMMHGAATLIKNATPDVIYQINDAGHSYTEMNRQAHPSTATYTVKKAGSESIAGYKAEHAIVTSSSGDTMEVWLNKELYELAKEFRPGGPGLDSEGVMKALKGAGMVGIPVKFIAYQTGKEEQKSQVELVSVTHKAQDASLFEIPEGYRKNDTSHGAAAGAYPSMTPEQREQMMQRLTPEQREQVQKAMGGGQP